MNGFQLKCVQLDLARQMEPIEVICSFIDMAKENGFNSVMLYLEDRIRTASYPYPEEGEAYSEDEIRQLVSYAQKRDIDLIPCVATLGHAERFLRHGKLSHLSEVRDGMVNRFGVPAVKDVFCIRNPDFYPFIEHYIGEIAKLFPSCYFHIGLDEFFNFNLCPDCRKAMPSLADEEQAFLNHILRIRKYLKKYDKRVMMWSDMFEFYTHVMDKLPCDVIVVDWQYQEDVRNYIGHLLDMKIEQRLEANDRLGLDTVLAPAEQRFANAPSMIRFAEGRKIFGFLLTMWEKTDTYLYRTFPLICYVGRLLSGEEPETAWQHAVEALFGKVDAVFARTIKLAELGPLSRHFSEISGEAFYNRPFSGLPLEQFECNQIALAMLRDAEGQVTTEIGRRVWLDLVNQLEEKVIRSEFKAAFMDTIDFGASASRTARAQAAAEMFRRMLARKEAQWAEFRPGITPNIYTNRKKELLKNLEERLAEQNRKSLVRIRYCMPDQYVVNFVRIGLCCDGKWVTVVDCGGFKADSLDNALFERVNVFEFEGTPEEISIECWGMGGRGIAYAEVRDAAGETYIPSAVIGLSGIVEHPEFLLDNDANFSWFGEQSTRRAYHNLSIAETRHKITLALKRR